MKTIKSYLPYVLATVVGLIAWSEVGGLYAKARAEIAAKTKRG